MRFRVTYTDLLSKKSISDMRVSIHFLFLCCLFAVQGLSAQFTQKPLPYAYNALEPYIDAQTMEIHFSRHHTAYINNLNKALTGTEAAGMDLEKILAGISKFPEAVRNNGGGHYNHELFWSVLTPEKNTQPSAELTKAITNTFTSLDSLKNLMNQAAATRFGSGWAWLVVSPYGKLEVCSTPNQDNPLMDIAPVKGYPILGIDVWEHAYYLKYQNKRGDYLASIWNVVNWTEVSKRFTEGMKRRKGLFDEWAEMKAFHKVMSETFHPSEEGNLEPIRTRSGEMVEKALALPDSKKPAEFNTPNINTSTKALIAQAKTVHKLVKQKADDKTVTEALNKAHDVFHTIVGLCRDEVH
jgi:superoxide dismutase